MTDDELAKLDQHSRDWALKQLQRKMQQLWDRIDELDLDPDPEAVNTVAVLWTEFRGHEVDERKLLNWRPPTIAEILGITRGHANGTN